MSAANGVPRVPTGEETATAASFVSLIVPIVGTIKTAFHKSINYSDLRKTIQTRRRGRDSNPGYPCGHTGFRDQHNRPLCHLSEGTRRRADHTLERQSLPDLRRAGISGAGFHVEFRPPGTAGAEAIAARRTTGFATPRIGRVVGIAGKRRVVARPCLDARHRTQVPAECELPQVRPRA